ncbi:hypothetical protein KIH74_14850 [Kineosporia sp. J2-2]|uniref:Calcium-binding protein n=1 Tax=Kineosporia corallincola TaxID=2835133 RepID=A0ABS5TGJ8_9ACTN|nr:calcium-binding protein [Kineosporia corallincola]MBT0770217.1 hypothetical protein [Kineosporia corallincola]
MTTAACLAALAPAQAAIAPATVRVSNSRLDYVAADGQANRLSVWLGPIHRVGNGFSENYLIDDVYPIRIAGGDCVHPRASDPTRVRCTVTHGSDSNGQPGGVGPASFALSYTGRFRLGDGDDTVRLHNPKDRRIFSQFWLGPGHDTALTRQSGERRDPSAVYGQDGQDRIVAGIPDSLSLVTGGNGDDWISLIGPAPVSDDDGVYRRETGNGVASGGNGDDQIHGGQGPQTLSGDAGDDRIDGGDGDDELNGGPGDDRLWGRQGNDTIRGGNGNDRLYGGLGRDRLIGGPGKDLTVAR